MQHLLAKTTTFFHEFQHLLAKIITFCYEFHTLLIIITMFFQEWQHLRAKITVFASLLFPLRSLPVPPRPPHPTPSLIHINIHPLLLQTTHDFGCFGIVLHAQAQYVLHSGLPPLSDPLPTTDHFLL